jgi:hypothetical protein
LAHASHNEQLLTASSTGIDLTVEAPSSAPPSSNDLPNGSAGETTSAGLSRQLISACFDVVCWVKLF